MEILNKLSSLGQQKQDMTRAVAVFNDNLNLSFSLEYQISLKVRQAPITDGYLFVKVDLLEGKKQSYVSSTDPVMYADKISFTKKVQLGFHFAKYQRLRFTLYCTPKAMTPKEIETIISEMDAESHSQTNSRRNSSADNGSRRASVQNETSPRKSIQPESSTSEKKPGSNLEVNNGLNAHKSFEQLGFEKLVYFVFILGNGRY